MPAESVEGTALLRGRVPAARLIPAVSRGANRAVVRRNAIVGFVVLLLPSRLLLPVDLLRRRVRLPPLVREVDALRWVFDELLDFDLRRP